MTVDSAAAIRFLRTAYEPDDWIAIFLKSYETGRTAQRVGPLSLFLEPRIHAWLRAMNAQLFNIYVSVNAIRPGVRARTKDAIGAVRHVFLEADQNGAQLLAALASRNDLPPASYVLESSPDRVHVFWRVADFSAERVERLQKHLAREFDTDPAATSCSQTTRLPGYRNYKHDPSHLVAIDYRLTEIRYAPPDFPTPPRPLTASVRSPSAPTHLGSLDVVDRARRYLARVEPAIAGRHGDLHTFRVCCRIVRGFALSDAEAACALSEWNARCEPPWTGDELRAKLESARRYGRELVGALAQRSSREAR